MTEIKPQDAGAAADHAVELRNLNWEADAYAHLLVAAVINHDALASLFDHLGDERAVQRVLSLAIDSLTWLRDNPRKRGEVATWARPNLVVQ